MLIFPDHGRTSSMAGDSGQRHFSRPLPFLRITGERQAMVGDGAVPLATFFPSSSITYMTNSSISRRTSKDARQFQRKTNKKRKNTLERWDTSCGLFFYLWSCGSFVLFIWRRDDVIPKADDTCQKHLKGPKTQKNLARPFLLYTRMDVDSRQTVPVYPLWKMAQKKRKR